MHGKPAVLKLWHLGLDVIMQHINFAKSRRPTRQMAQVCSLSTSVSMSIFATGGDAASAWLSAACCGRLAPGVIAIAALLFCAALFVIIDSMADSSARREADMKARAFISPLRHACRNSKHKLDVLLYSSKSKCLNKEGARP